jgi:hypothetical protein
LYKCASKEVDVGLEGHHRGLSKEVVKGEARAQGCKKVKMDEKN